MRLCRRIAAAMLVLCAAAWACAAGEPGGEPVALRHRFPKDAPRYFKVKTLAERSNLTPLLPEPLVNHEDREWWFVMKSASKAVDPADISLSVDRIQAIRRDRPGQSETRFDSLRKPPPPLAAGLTTWDGRSLDFRVGSDGTVTRPTAARPASVAPPPATGPNASTPAGARPNSSGGVPGPTTTRPAAPVSPPVAPPPPPPPTASEIDAPFAPPSDADMDALLNVLFGSYLPPRAVRVGESWNQPYVRQRPPYGSFAGELAYRLVSVASREGRQVATIEFSGDLKLSPSTQPASSSGDLRRYDLHLARYSGSVLFDLDAGELVSFDGREELKLDLVLSSQPRPAPAPPTSQADGAPKPATQPSAPVLSYTFHMSEQRVLSAAVSRIPPVKPIIIQASQPVAPPTPVLPPGARQPMRPVVVPPRPVTQPAVPTPTTRPAPAGVMGGKSAPPRRPATAGVTENHK